MAIGMTYEQYWFEDPLMVRDFRKAHKLKQEMQNEAAWLNGLYTWQALSASLCNLFKKKNEAPIEYPSEPIDFGLSDRKKEPMLAKEQEEELERLKLVAILEAYRLKSIESNKDK